MCSPGLRAGPVRSFLAVWLLLASGIASGIDHPAPQLEVRDLAASAGYFQLRWEGPGDRFLLEQSESGDFSASPAAGWSAGDRARR